MPTEVEAVVVRKDGAGVISATAERVDLPPLLPGQLLIAPEYVGICGSDLEQLHGRMPVTFHINFPHTLGHEWAGTVAELGEGVTGFDVGDRVTGHGLIGGNDWFGVTHDGAMADLFTVNASMCLRLPDSIDMVTAAIIEPFACVLTGLRKAGGVSAADVVHVYGLGTMGLCVVVQALTAGAAVYGFDLSPFRREAAASLGATAVLDPREGHEVPPATLVVEVSGSPIAMASALESAGTDGRVLMMGLSQPRTEGARLGLIQERGLTVLASTGAPPAVWPDALRYVEQAGIDLRPLASSILPFGEFEEAYRRAQDAEHEIKVLVRPGERPSR